MCSTFREAFLHSSRLFNPADGSDDVVHNKNSISAGVVNMIHV